MSTIIEEEYAQEIQEMGIRAYTGTREEDALILDWWSRLVETDEIEDTFMPATHALGSFYKLFQRPNWLFYDRDEMGFTLCIWAEPAMSSAFVGLWIAPRARKCKKTLRAMQLIYATLFTIFSVVLGITKQEKLLTTHEKLGYNVVGKIPALWGTEPAWVLSLSREDFESGRLNPCKGG
jgi:hypothetical protein